MPPPRAAPATPPPPAALRIGSPRLGTSPKAAKPPPLSPLQKLAAMDDKPLKLTLKQKALEYAPPKSLTIREMRITYKAASTLLLTTRQRVDKMIGFCHGLRTRAVAIYTETNQYMDNNKSISEGGATLAETMVKGGLRELRDISERTRLAMEKQGSDLGDLAARLARCRKKMEKHDELLNPVKGKPAPDAVSLHYDCKETSTVADLARAECVTSHHAARDYSIKLENSRSLLQAAARALITAKSPRPIQPLPAPVRWPEERFPLVSHQDEPPGSPSKASAAADEDRVAVPTASSSKPNLRVSPRKDMLTPKQQPRRPQPLQSKVPLSKERNFSKALDAVAAEVSVDISDVAPAQEPLASRAAATPMAAATEANVSQDAEALRAAAPATEPEPETSTEAPEDGHTVGKSTAGAELDRDGAAELELSPDEPHDEPRLSAGLSMSPGSEPPLSPGSEGVSVEGDEERANRLADDVEPGHLIAILVEPQQEGDAHSHEVLEAQSAAYELSEDEESGVFGLLSAGSRVIDSFYYHPVVDDGDDAATWMTPSEPSDTVKVPVQLLLVPHFSAVPASDPVSDAQSEALTRGAIVIPPEVMAEIYGELARYDGGEDAEEEGAEYEEEVEEAG